MKKSVSKEEMERGPEKTPMPDKRDKKTIESRKRGIDMNRIWRLFAWSITIYPHNPKFR